MYSTTSALNLMEMIFFVGMCWLVHHFSRDCHLSSIKLKYGISVFDVNQIMHFMGYVMIVKEIKQLNDLQLKILIKRSRYK